MIEDQEAFLNGKKRGEGVSMECRFCKNSLKHVFVDLINSPPSNSYLEKEELKRLEKYYPLKVFVCDECFLVQIDEYKDSKEIFNEKYAYFSSFSRTWLRHCKEYVDMIIKRLGIGKDSLVVEIASNDGYLLQYFKEKEIPCFGIEPTRSTAKVAIEKGIETLEEFFGEDLAKKLVKENKKSYLIMF